MVEHEFDALRAALVGGAGVVARYPGVLCVAVADDPDPLRRLLELCEESAGGSPGRLLARRLASWLSGPDSPPDSLSFGTLAEAGDRLAVFLLGGVSVRVPRLETTVSGADSAAWIDLLLDRPDAPMVLAVDGVDAPADRLAGVHNLRAGVVPGVGVVLSADADVTRPAADSPAGLAGKRSEPAPRGSEAARLVEPADARPLPEPAGVKSEPADRRGDGTPHPIPVPPLPVDPDAPLRPPRRAEPILGIAPGEEARSPLEPGSPAGVGKPSKVAGLPGESGAESATTQDTPSQEPQASGYLCSRGHLNDPRSHFCVLCGIRMNERTGVSVVGPRPPLGLLVFDDGATYTVDAEYLVGRTPDVDERVRDGSVRSIAVEDNSGVISRVHAELRLNGWDVMLVDSGSRNGTFVAAPGEQAWSQVPHGESHRLAPGTRVRLGNRTFVFESPSGVR